MKWKPIRGTRKNKKREIVGSYDGWINENNWKVCEKFVNI